MSENVLHRYEVGMGSDKRVIQAPHAGAAAMYYALQCVHTNNPFMAAVYTEDGKAFNGEAFWMSLFPNAEHVEMVFGRVTKADFEACTVIATEEKE